MRRKFEVNEKKDRSGIKLYKTQTRPKYVAGIFMMFSTLFDIPPNKDSYEVDMSCVYQNEYNMDLSHTEHILMD